MKYWILLLAPLIGCAAASEADEPLQQAVIVTGGAIDSCAVIVDGTAREIAASAFAGLATDRPVRLVAGPDTSYQCVTEVMDGLNDLRFSVTLDTPSWQALPSVARGEEKLAHDLAGESGHPEAQPFDRDRDAEADVERALEKARRSGNPVLLVMGANWCHDSRALSGWFASPRFAAMLAAKYELAYVDVGRKDRNIDIARRFGLEGIEGTPTILVLSADGTLLNNKSAPSWRNAASRGEEEIFTYFNQFTSE